MKHPPSTAYFEVELRAVSGARYSYGLVTEEAALRCIAHYAEKARREAAVISAIPGLAAPVCEIESDVVIFRWASPVGPVSWRAYLRRLYSEDHLWPAPSEKSTLPVANPTTGNRPGASASSLPAPDSVNP